MPLPGCVLRNGSLRILMCIAMSDSPGFDARDIFLLSMRSLSQAGD